MAYICTSLSRSRQEAYNLTFIKSQAPRSPFSPECCIALAVCAVTCQWHYFHMSRDVTSATLVLVAILLVLKHRQHLSFYNNILWQDCSPAYLGVHCTVILFTNSSRSKRNSADKRNSKQNPPGVGEGRPVLGICPQEEIRGSSTGLL